MEKVTNRLKIKSELGRALVGEFLGTAVLVLVISGTVAQQIIPRPTANTLINVNIGVGLGIAFGVALCARVSGGHINPAVSLMFLTFRQLTPVRFLLYALVQTLGAFVGAATAYLVYRDAINAFDGGTRQVYGTKATAGIFSSYPSTHLGTFNGLIDQIVATALFCLLIAHITDKRNHYPSWVQPLLVGSSFVMIGTAFAYNAGYPLNPARDLGPRLFSFLLYGSEVFGYKNYGWFWVPIVGPFIGAVLGGWLYQLAIGIHHPAGAVVQEEYVAVATTGQRELHPLTAGAKDVNGAEEA